MRTFDEIVGNDAIKEYLFHMIDKGAIGNSWLFSGINGIGKGLFAEALAARLMGTADSHKAKLESGNHPDLTILRPQGKVNMHSIDAIRDFCALAQQAPFEASHRVFIIHDAEKMLPTSANALLKTFEEPAAATVIILLSSAPERLLPTILSRCRKVSFHPVDTDTIATYLQKEGKDPSFAALSRGSVARALRLANQGADEKRDLLLRVLAAGRFRDYTQLKEGVASLSGDIDEQKKSKEKAMQEELPKEMPATQKAALLKEIDGAIATQYLEEVDNLFDILLSWYRDLTLLQVSGDPRHLYNPDVKSLMENALQRELSIPLDQVQEALASARLAIARSLPLSQCLESLFLKLNFL